MKTCRDCLLPFDDDKEQDYDPARELGDINLKSAGATSDDDLCHQCRAKLGMMNLMGFIPMKPE